MLDAYEPPEVRDDFTSSLMRRIRAEEADARAEKPMPIRLVPVHGRWRLAAAVAACLAVVLAVGLLWDRPPDTGRRPSDGDVAMASITDEEIIRELDLFENAEMLADLDLFADLDVIENLDDSSLPDAGGA
jgi:hypothetical protein